MKVSLFKKLVKILIKEVLEPSDSPEGWSQPTSKSLYSPDYLNQLMELGKLSEREQIILRLRLDGFTREEIGKKYGTTRTRINQIEQAAIRKLKSAARKDNLIPTIATLKL